MKNQVQGIYARGHKIFILLKNRISRIQGPGLLNDTGDKTMKRDCKQLIIDLIQELKNNGVRYEDIAVGLYVCEKTIRNYSKGKIPNGKIKYILNYIKSNYKEIYEDVLQKE